jgi:hypothetical protein
MTETALPAIPIVNGVLFPLCLRSGMGDQGAAAIVDGLRDSAETADL